MRARQVRRTGARVHDDVWATGTIGDAAGALVQWRAGGMQSAKLRYRLESNGRVLASMEETVSDMAYSVHLGSYAGSEPLSQEKYMLKRWFRERFAKN